MKSLVFDTGPIISLATNSLLWLLTNLKERYGGEFLIPKDVELELVERPIETKRFKLEALQVNREINKGILKVVDTQQITTIKQELMMLANNCFSVKNMPVKIVHEGEMAALALAIINDADAVVIDERTTRDLIEDPEHIARRLSERLHANVNINKDTLRQVRKRIGNIKVIRSVELTVVGYDLGWFDKYLTKDKNSRKILMEAILWGIKMRGASISQKEIDKIVRMEK